MAPFSEGPNSAALENQTLYTLQKPWGFTEDSLNTALKDVLQHIAKRWLLELRKHFTLKWFEKLY